MISKEEMMGMALSLARKGIAGVQPNPMVGAVIVNGDEIVGEGFHERIGEDHAEVRALRVAGERAKGGTLYINLEPCNHYGRTPPCTQAIIAAGLAKVVCADRDPNPLVNGSGFAALEENGIGVEEGVLRGDARQLNEVYYNYITLKRPFVTLKLAQSLDGKLVYPGTKWITGIAARRRVHEMRACHAAILVGRGTVDADDPLLTVRYGEYAASARQPLRVVVDSDLRIREDSRLIKTAGEFPTLVYTGEEGEKKAGKLTVKGVEVRSAPRVAEGMLDLEWILTDLGSRMVSSILVEGGREIAAAFLAKGLVHKMHIFIAPHILGDRDAAAGLAAPPGLESFLCTLGSVEVERLGSDILFRGYPVRAGA
jgi:diaminohydroxyphosphoribosylaminopyrimidine deaminase/5-amino-6-(5-phosphoribosylamino)uracil reductase